MQGGLGLRRVFRGVPRYNYYALDEGVKFLDVSGHQLLVNPRIGGWAELDDLEMAVAVNPDGIEPTLGEELFQAGVATRNGLPIYRQFSHPMENLLFFYELNLGFACTLSCVYCSSKAGPNVRGESMSVELAKMIIGRIVEHVRATSQSRVKIEFTGGEPMLAWEIIEQTVRYCRSFPELTWDCVVQSNLTYLRDEWIPIIKELNIGLGASIDGPRDIHDAQRPLNGRSSFDATWENIVKLRGSGIEVSAAISVVTSRTQHSLPSIARFLVDRGFVALSFSPVQMLARASGDPSLETDGQVYSESLLDVLYQVIIPHYRRTGILIRERQLGTALAQLLQPQKRYMCMRTPCGAGRNICSITPDGDVYQCNQSPFLGEGMRLGNIVRETFADILASPTARNLSERLIENIPECKDCPYSGWCQSPCGHYTLLRKGRLLAKSAYCDHYLTLLRGLLGGLLDGKIEPDFAEMFSDI